MRIHSIIPHSKVNGPGTRTVLHTQGCSVRCPGCFSQHTWSPEGGVWRDISLLAKQLAATAKDGLTILGGEPFDQANELIRLVVKVRYYRPELSILVYSGYTEAELMGAYLSAWPSITRFVDAMILGPYDVKEAANTGSIWGSSNQVLRLYSDKHTPEDFNRVAEVELMLSGEGVVITGYPSGQLLSTFRSEDVVNRTMQGEDEEAEVRGSRAGEDEGSSGPDRGERRVQRNR